MSDLSYPVGKFQIPEIEVSAQRRIEWIEQISEAPEKLKQAVKSLTAEQIETPYRPGGWTLRQLAHHIPDSHLNAYMRTKLALTEEDPLIKPYDQDRWSELYDVQVAPVEVSISLLEALHSRWVLVWKSLSDQDYLRNFIHPELGKMNLNQQLALYAWHGRHHVVQITSLRERMGW